MKKSFKLGIFSFVLFLLIPYSIVNAQQSYFYIDGERTILEYSVKQQETEQYITICDDKKFEYWLNETKEEIEKRENVWAFFFLPENSNKYFLYIRKEKLDKNKRKILISLIQKLYITISSVETRLGYSDIFFETDSLGNWRYSSNGDSFNPSRIVYAGQGVIIWEQKPLINYGYWPPKTRHRRERIMKQKNSFIFLKEDAGPGKAVPTKETKD